MTPSMVHDRALHILLRRENTRLRNGFSRLENLENKELKQ